MASTNLEFIISAIDKASGVFNGVGGASQGMSTKIATAANAVGGAMATRAVVNFGQDSYAAFSESQQSAVELQYALDQFPLTADTNAEALMRLNSQLALKTKFDDDATASGQAVLAQFGLTGAQIEEMTPLLQDYAARTGKDLPTAAADLGKALQGQGRALKTIGLDLTDTGTASGNYTQLMAGLRDQVGGFAEEQGASAAGTADRMKNSFGELQETTGGLLAPAIEFLTEKGIALTTWMQDHETATKIIVGVVAALAIGYGVLSAATTISAGVSAIRALAVGTETAATAAGTVANTGFAVSMWAAMAPVLLIVAAIAAVIAVVVLLVTHWDTVKAAGAAAWDWIKNAWSSAGDFFAGIGSAISGGFKAAFNAVAGFWNSTVGSLSWDVPDWVPIIGGNTMSTPRMPLLATGGDVTRGGFAVVGERGAEVVELPAGARVWPNGTGPGGGSGPTINITNHYPQAEATSVTTNRALDYAALLGV